MGSYHVRRFEKSDANEVSELIIKTLRTTNIQDYSEEYIENDVKRFTPSGVLERASWTNFYVVCDVDRIVGCGAIGSYWGKVDESSLFNIFVLPEFQGKGIGRKIIETLEQDEYFLRAKRIEIPASITACEFYKKMGYTYKNGIDVVDEEQLFRLEKFNSLAVNQVKYRSLRLLGYGKGGYSYLAERDGKHYVLKQIHHEPCEYYSFGNKIEAERNDYHRLLQTGIRMPKMLDIDLVNERVLKEYIDGPTIFDLVKNDAIEEKYIDQIRKMAEIVRAAGLNIDYFPTNFVVQNEEIFYIDYECNAYMDEWNFENWGIKYWSKTPEFIEYVNCKEAL